MLLSLQTAGPRPLARAALDSKKLGGEVASGSPNLTLTGLELDNAADSELAAVPSEPRPSRDQDKRPLL